MSILIPDWLFGLIVGLIAGSLGSIFVILRSGLINGMIEDSFLGIVDNMAESIKKNPKMLENIIQPVLAEIFRELGTQGQQKSRSMNIFGIKVPSEIIQWALQRFGGKMLDETKSVVESSFPTLE